jgi:hypothetical protein
MSPMYEDSVMFLVCTERQILFARNWLVCGLRLFLHINLPSMAVSLVLCVDRLAAQQGQCIFQNGTNLLQDKGSVATD